LGRVGSRGCRPSSVSLTSRSRAKSPHHCQAPPAFRPCARASQRATRTHARAVWTSADGAALSLCDTRGAPSRQLPSQAQSGTGSRLLPPRLGPYGPRLTVTAVTLSTEKPTERGFSHNRGAEI
jgi:hypothetical protein